MRKRLTKTIYDKLSENTKGKLDHKTHRLDKYADLVLTNDPFGYSYTRTVDIGGTRNYFYKKQDGRQHRYDADGRLQPKQWRPLDWNPLQSHSSYVNFHNISIMICADFANI